MNNKRKISNVEKFARGFAFGAILGSLSKNKKKIKDLEERIIELESEGEESSN